MTELVKSESALSDYLASSGVPLLVFRQGDFSSGDTEIALGTRFVARPIEHRIGLQRWEDKKPAESRMGYLHEGFIIPARSSLGFLDESQWELDQNGKPRDPWQSSESIPFIADDNEEFLFVTGSWGGHAALVKLQKAYRLDGSKRDPVIELATEKRKNSFGGTNARPVFNVVGWVGVQSPAPAQITPPVVVTSGPLKTKKKTATIIDDGLPAAWD